MEPGPTYRKLLKLINEQGALTFMQVDPPEIGADKAAEIARIGEAAGINAWAVGGSVGAQGQLLDEVIHALKENSGLPVILFPGNIATLHEHADAVYFMSMLNSLDPYYISGAQTAAAYPVKQLNLEPIPTSYIIVEPGRAVGWVGRAQAIPRNLPYLAAITALAGEYMGSKLVILESGGGAPAPAPPDMVALTKKTISVPLVVAGGVRSPQHATETIAAGADIIHVGTAIEKSNGDLNKAQQTIRGICDAVKKAAKARR